MNWDDITLYHGTTNIAWKSMLNDGVKIPGHDSNWLGRGMYFGVNNALTPIKFALNNCSRSITKALPVIIEIKSAKLEHNVLDKVLNLTNHSGLVDWYFISEKFKAFVKYLSPELRQSLQESPLYSSTIKTAVTLDMEWYLFLKQIEPIISGKEYTSPFILNLKSQAAIHIYNLIIDWFNYSISGGDEEEIPIKGMLGTFNTGEPISSFELGNGRGASKRVFFDFISFLNRIELSIFGFKYYQNYIKDGKGWELSNLFQSGQVAENEDYHIYTGKDQLIGLLENIIDANVRMRDDKEVYEAHMLCEDLYNILGAQQDTLNEY